MVVQKGLNKVSRGVQRSKRVQDEGVLYGRDIDSNIGLGLGLGY